MKIHILAFVALFVAIGGAVHAETKEELVSKYQGDPNTSPEIKEAIRKGVVIKGMCPFQAFAAAGLPGPYMVKRDNEKWGDHVPPPKIISTQCETPDNSVIELAFRNKSQFKTEEPVSFRVRFVKGKAVLIDQKKFGED
jgi:hypothetical protein